MCLRSLPLIKAVSQWKIESITVCSQLTQTCLQYKFSDTTQFEGQRSELSWEVMGYRSSGTELVAHQQIQ